MSISLPTFQDLYDLAKNEIITKDTSLNDFNEGSALDVHAGITSVVGTELVYQLSRIIKAYYVRTATGEDLDNRVRDFNITRKTSTATNGNITITRTKYNLSENIPANTTFKCDDGTEFYNENPVYFAAGQQSITFEVIAKVPGVMGNVLANQINTISPSTTNVMSITHLEFGNGTDEETDDQLRDRFYLELSTMTRGTAPALRAGALRFDGVSNASVQKIHSGYCRLYIDAGSGIPSPALLAAIQSEIDDNWRAAGEKVEVIAAETISIDMNITVIIDTEYTEMESEILEGIRNAISDFLQTKAMGESVYRSEIIKTVMDVTGIVDCTVETPSSNIPGQASKIPRAGVITIVSA